MEHMLIIWSGELTPQQIETPEIKAAFGEYLTWIDEMKEAGVFVSTAGLAPSVCARTVEVRDGQKLVTDGPFAETKEQILGLFLIDAEDIDAAIEWAAKSPAARHGSVEVRALHEARPMMEEAVKSLEE